jgi:subtilase family serine protease
MRFWKFLLPILASTLSFAAPPDRIAGPINSSQTIALAKSLHPKAQPQYDLGVVEPSLKLSYVTLLMAPSASQQKALDQLLAQQQDRTSPNYHKWLTPQQFADRFGLSPNDLSKVTTWLKYQGFQILSTGGGRNSVIFSGTAAQAQNAFGTEIHNYSVNGEEHFANSTPLMIPSALNGIVRSVMGLHDFRPHPANGSRRSGAMGNVRANYYAASFKTNFLAPGDIATIYDLGPLYSASTPIDGTGQKLAIVGQTDILLADINDFRSGFGLTPIPTGTGGCTTSASGIIISPCTTTNLAYVLVGTDPGTVSAGDIGEADLDVEWSGAVARNAQIIFVNAPSTAGGVNDSLTDVIDPSVGTAPLAPVVSMSYGICEAESGDMETLFQQGNAEGVTILNSSGDVGAATCDDSPPGSTATTTPPLPFKPAIGGLAVSYPASSPEVTAVGGTEISIADDTDPSSFWSTTIGADGGTAQTYIPEIEWNDDVELAQLCQEEPITFCTVGGSPAVPKWVPITSAATAQEDIWLSIGGGGASNCFTESTGGVCMAGFPQPTWQKGLSVPSAPPGVRYVPDVSLLASPNFPGYILCTPQNPPTTDTSTCVSGIPSAVDTFQSIVGGTSVSSPVFAGIVTLMNQFLNGPSSPGLGNINPLLYTLAATPSNTVFHTVTSGDNMVYCQVGTPTIQPAALQCPAGGVMGFSASNFDTTTKYNLVTGLGSVDANNLAIAWKAFLTPDFALTATTLAPSPISAGQSASATLTIAPVTGSVGTVVNFSPSSCTGLPAGATCSFSPASVTFTGTANAPPVTVTISTLPNMAPSGPTTISITPTNSSNTTATVSLTVTATTETFSLTSPNGATFSVAPGGNAQVSIAVGSVSTPSFINSSNNTTALSLTYSCSAFSGSAEIACNFTPQSTNAAAVTLNLQTTAPTTQLRPPLGRGTGIFYALLLPGMFGIVCLGGSRTRGLRLLSLIVVLGFSTLWLGACGGSNNSSQQNPGTPAGMYAVTITAATGGASPIANSGPPLTITLTVN